METINLTFHLVFYVHHSILVLILVVMFCVTSRGQNITWKLYRSPWLIACGSWFWCTNSTGMLYFSHTEHVRRSFKNSMCPVAQVAYRYHIISGNKHNVAVNILLHCYFSSFVAVIESFQTIAINGECCLRIFSLGLKLPSLIWIYPHFAPSCCRNTPNFLTAIILDPHL